MAEVNMGSTVSVQNNHRNKILGTETPQEKLTFHQKAMGIDIGAIAESEIKVKSMPLDKKQETIERETKVIAAFSEFQDKVSALRDAAAKLSDPSSISGLQSSFQHKRANATATTGGILAANLVAITVVDYTANQNFNLQINNIASSDKCISSSSFSTDETTALVLSGSITLSSTSNTAQSVTIDATMSLTDIRNAINSVESLTKVHASIVQISETDFRLNLSHTETGKKITLSDTGSVLSGLHLAESSAANDNSLSACVVFNGITTYSRSNTITTLVPGITIEPLSASLGNTISVTIEPDLNAAKTDIVSFVNAYNDFVDFTTEQTKRDDDQNYAEDDYLARNGLFSTLTSSIQTGIFAPGIGITAGHFQLLRDIGIKSADDNIEALKNSSTTKSFLDKLVINDKILDSALLGSFDQVKQLFAFSSSSTNSSFLVTSHPDTLSRTVAGNHFSVTVTNTAGIYSVQFTLGGTTATGTVESVDDGGLLRIVGPVGTIFEGINLGYIGSAIAAGHSATSNVTLRQGIADQLNTYLTNTLLPEQGSFAVEREILDTRNDSLKTELSELQERFERERQSILQKYAKLEQVMKSKENLMKDLTAYMGALTTKNR